MTTPIKPHVIAFDTLCEGWQAIKEDGDKIAIYTTQEELDDDLEFFGDDCFAVPLEDFEEGRKFFFNVTS